MTKEQMAEGLAAGKSLIQEEWADWPEICAVNELVRDGKAETTIWEWKASYQCECRIITPKVLPPKAHWSMA